MSTKTITDVLVMEINSDYSMSATTEFTSYDENNIKTITTTGNIDIIEGNQILNIYLPTALKNLKKDKVTSLDIIFELPTDTKTPVGITICSISII
ncbi:hypothetical protein D3C76_1396040 [compost metagenome]